jgi:N6-L-threonylcarbamoyladenine synthase
MEGTWDFSFSGLKTSVLRTVQALNSSAEQSLPVADLAASFQAAVVDALVSKTLSAARTYKVSQIVVAGGVSANKALRQAFLEQKEFPVQIPPFEFCTDNAAMIGSAGYYRFVKGDRSGMDVDVLPNWPLS